MTAEPLSALRLYEQLAERIRQNILSGALKPGDKLPTERILAEDYGVSRTVVREAVKALKQEGLIEIKAGLGTFVVDGAGRAFSQSLGSLKRGQMHHKRILEAIRRGDADAAQYAMQAHLQQVRRNSEVSPTQQA